MVSRGEVKVKKSWGKVLEKYMCVCVAALGLHSCIRAFSSSWEQGLLSSCSVRASLVVEHRLYIRRFQQL